MTAGPMYQGREARLWTDMCKGTLVIVLAFVAGIAGIVLGLMLSRAFLAY